MSQTPQDQIDAVTTPSHDVIVIGAGVIGLAVAWDLSSRGARVAVFERDRPGQATSRVAAGMLAPVGELDFGDRELLELNLASARLYPELARRLEAVSGLDAGLIDNGALHVALDRDEAGELKRILELQQSCGLDSKWLGPAAAREVEPALNPELAGAVLAAGDAVVDPRALCAALVGAIETTGSTIRSGSAVESLLTVDGRPWSGRGPVGGVRLSDGSEHFAPVVVAAAGPESGRVDWLPAELRPPVRPVKGQVVELQGDPGDPVVSRIVGTERVYVAPRRDGRVILGATVEEMDFDPRVTAGGVHEMLREGYRLIPEIAELEFIGAETGFRPGTPDNMPVIGPVAEGLILATGHYRNGILLAPVTAQTVAGLVAGDPLDGPAAVADPGRFNRSRKGVT
ncbi:MAG: glycine oxidase ThiO [Solirubrobacterales bacterium]|nr:glycine oxidase ThiO [Solirubrobacterales bacterium]